MGINVNELRLARALSVSEYDTPNFLVAIGTLADGRSVRMRCPYRVRSHIQSLTLV